MFSENLYDLIETASHMSFCDFRSPTPSESIGRSGGNQSPAGQREIFSDPTIPLMPKSDHGDGMSGYGDF